MTRHLFLGLACMISFCSSAQTNLPEDYLTPSFHKSRRDAARERMPENSVMVVFAYPERNYSNDVDYIYHPNPDLYYFTGYKEPNAVLFIFKEQQRQGDTTFNELFFVQERNARMEQWNGRRLGELGVREKLGIASAFNTSSLNRFTIPLSGFKSILMRPFTDDASLKQGVGYLYSTIFEVKTKGEKIQNLDSKKYSQIIASLREIKTPEELDLIRKAVEISCKGQNEVMKTVRPDMSELEIQGLHEYIHKRYGAESAGYGAIIGAGENGCILHYMENSKTRVGNTMLLMDVGAEYHGYTADVTRTIPAHGKFTAEERAIYQIVYEAQEAAFATLKDGARWRDATKAAQQTIINGLKKLGIIQADADLNKYYPHGLGHHIGLDVHDAGTYDTLRKNMVLTIEPGIYIPEGSPCDKKWWGIAVRIEDDALITKDGYELLSHFAPRSIAEIEKMIAENSVLDKYKLPPLESGNKKKKDF